MEKEIYTTINILKEQKKNLIKEIYNKDNIEANINFIKN